jgi:2-hydroxy-3-keto-5-methylthiopentenyl-1-phosphate phosphatase
MDFDGTISVDEVSVALLQRFAEGDWVGPFLLHVAGEITLPELMRRQFALIRRPKEELVQFVQDTTEIRRGFEQFVRFCHEQGVPLGICSAGMDLYVEAALAMLDIPPVAVVAVGKTEFARDGIHVHFPEGREGLDFKATAVRAKQQEGYQVVYVGDGISDFGAAKVADFVFARTSLLEKCQEYGVPHHVFEDFGDVQRCLARFLRSGRWV